MKSKTRPILVLGGTGHYGRHIVRCLRDRGEPVRVLSRDATAARALLTGQGLTGKDNLPGAPVEIVEGDITAWTTVVAALAAARAVVIAVSAFSPKAIRRLRQIERDAILMVLDEAGKAGISRLVFVSIYDIRRDVIEELGMETARYKLEVENTLARSTLDWTVLGAAPSMDIFFTMIRGKRMMVPGGGRAALPTVSALDVGQIAAQAALRDDLGGQRLRMVGPEAISFPEAASRISAVWGRDLKVTEIPLLPLQAAAVVTRPVNPFLHHLVPSIKLMNQFPADIASTVRQDHRRLTETFDYVPTTLEMEARRRMPAPGLETGAAAESDAVHHR